MKDALLEFIQNEVAAEEREVQNMHRASVSNRVKNGHCITGLKFKEVNNEGLFIYSYLENQSKFRAGDLLVINKEKLRGEAVLTDGVLVWLDEIDHRQRLIKLELDQQQEPPCALNCTVDKGFYDYNSERLKQSIMLAFEDDQIAAFLEGQAALPSVNDLSQEAVERCSKQNSYLTARQAQALASTRSNFATFIQGPPGSGKTFLLALIIEQLMSEGRSVLVTAPTHKAIDNLLLSACKNLSAKYPVIKIRGKGKTPNLDQQILQTTTDDQRLSNLKAPFLIGATIHQAYKFIQNSNLYFDLVVIDEASQMPVAHVAPALLNGPRYVIAGDHRQLPPVLKSAAHPDVLKKSVFESLHGHYPQSTILLDVTFRMNSTINEFPSRAFYGNLLLPSKCAADRIFVPRFTGLDKIDQISEIIRHQGAITFIELDHQNAIQQAPGEADLVARLGLSLLSDHKVDPESLAIVSPHRAHNEAIRKRLLHYAAVDLHLSALANRVVVDTVERLQGQERDVVIFSLCASHRQYAINKSGFLYSPNRLNVAITRSRTKLFIVGSKYFFPHINGIVIDSHLFKLWEDYYEYLTVNDFRISSAVFRISDTIN